MIKRRFYRYEYGDRDAPSESSSSSDSEVEAEATDETEDEEEENDVADVRVKGEVSSSSGYESEDSSVNEVNLDSSGLPISDEDVAAQNGGRNLPGSLPIAEGDNALAVAVASPPAKDVFPFDVTDCVLKCKSVFKCKLCPRIICLSEETIKAHLNSKRHARSEKLRREGRLKLMLNDEGKIEGEMHVEDQDEDQDTTTVSGQNSAKPKKRSKGRFKSRRTKQETRSGKGRQPTERWEKRRKSES